MTTLTLTKALTTAGNEFELNGTYSVSIELTSIKENVDKTLKDFDNPVAPGSADSKQAKKSIIDMKWYKEAYEYQGHIMVAAYDCKSGDSDVIYSNYEQKNILKAMAQQGGGIQLILQTDSNASISQVNEKILFNAGSGTTTAWILKLAFTDRRTEGELPTDTDATQIVGHDVIIGILRGTELGS